MPIVMVAPAPIAPDAIAPPLNTVIRQSSEQVRDDGKSAHRFRIARTLTFASEPTGFRATVILRSADAEADPEERRRYTLANAPLVDRPIVMHIDRTGALLAIDDLDAVWRDWAGGLTAAAPPGSDARSDALRQRLAALSVPQRQAMIGSIAGALFAAPDERRVAPQQPVTLASPPPFADLTLAGTVTTVAEGQHVRVRTAATGRAAATANAAAASVAVTIDRLVDPASGLLLAWSRRESLAGRGAKLTTTTSMQLTW